MFKAARFRTAFAATSVGLGRKGLGRFKDRFLVQAQPARHVDARQGDHQPQQVVGDDRGRGQARNDRRQDAEHREGGRDDGHVEERQFKGDAGGVVGVQDAEQQQAVGRGAEAASHLGDHPFGAEVDQLAAEVPDHEEGDDGDGDADDHDGHNIRAQDRELGAHETRHEHDVHGQAGDVLLDSGAEQVAASELVHDEADQQADDEPVKEEEAPVAQRAYARDALEVHIGPAEPEVGDEVGDSENGHVDRQRVDIGCVRRLVPDGVLLFVLEDAAQEFGRDRGFLVHVQALAHDETRDGDADDECRDEADVGVDEPEVASVGQAVVGFPHAAEGHALARALGEAVGDQEAVGQVQVASAENVVAPDGQSTDNGLEGEAGRPDQGHPHAAAQVLLAGAFVAAFRVRVDQAQRHEADTEGVHGEGQELLRRQARNPGIDEKEADDPAQDGRRHKVALEKFHFGPKEYAQEQHCPYHPKSQKACIRIQHTSSRVYFPVCR